MRDVVKEEVKELKEMLSEAISFTVPPLCFKCADLRNEISALTA